MNSENRDHHKYLPIEPCKLAIINWHLYQLICMQIVAHYDHTK